MDKPHSNCECCKKRYKKHVAIKRAVVERSLNVTKYLQLDQENRKLKKELHDVHQLSRTLRADCEHYKKDLCATLTELSSLHQESWVLGLHNKFKNMRKKVKNCPPEMVEKRAQSLHKRSRQPSSQAPNKKLCRLFDCSHLVVYGESAESMMRHNEWLNENAAVAATDAVMPRLLATAQERHERLRSLTISEALVLFPFLASEASLLLKFDNVFQKNIGDDFAKGCEQLCDIVLKHADDAEVTAFSNVATENPILATFDFVAARCKDSLSVVLSEKDVPLTLYLLKEADWGLSLYIDRECIIRATSLLGGIVCLFASFWVFNVGYPQKAHRLLTFFNTPFCLCATRSHV